MVVELEVREGFLGAFEEVGAQAMEYQTLECATSFYTLQLAPTIAERHEDTMPITRGSPVLFLLRDELSCGSAHPRAPKGPCLSFVQDEATDALQHEANRGPSFLGPRRREHEHLDHAPGDHALGQTTSCMSQEAEHPWSGLS